MNKRNANGKKQKLDRGESLATMKKVLHYLAAYRVLFVLSLLLAAVVVVLTLYLPILTGRAIDLLVGQGEVDPDGSAARHSDDCRYRHSGDGGVPVADEHRRQPTSPSARSAAMRAAMPSGQLQRLPPVAVDPRPPFRRGDTVSRVIADADQVTDGLLIGFYPAVHRRPHHCGRLGLHADQSIRSVTLRGWCLITPALAVGCGLRGAAHQTCSMFTHQSAYRAPSRPPSSTS